MAKDRSKDDRRSVGSHEKMMGALGRAAGWEPVSSHSRYGGVIGEIGKSRVNYTGQPHVREVESNDHSHEADEKNSKMFDAGYPGVV